jgi:hypothetical protein
MAPHSLFPESKAPLPDSLSGHRCPAALLFIWSEKTLGCFLLCPPIHKAYGVPKNIFLKFKQFTHDNQIHLPVSA